jgi:hypothetical protein
VRTPHTHPLRLNDRTWTPHLVGFFDTEFPADPTNPGSPQLFKCACAAAVRRHGKGRNRPPGELRTTDPDELASWVERTAEPDLPLWLYGHHVAVDVQAAGLLDALLQRGWELGRHGLANPSLWAQLRKGHRSLHLCDSMSLFGVGEKRLGELVGYPKLSMPGYGDDLQEWLDYCWRDVEIGLVALTVAMDDWERNNMGRWTDTGPGCGWNSLRHRIKAGSVWIIPDERARAFERAAIYAGRRELLQFGQLPEPEYCDLDLVHAHTSVAACFSLPADRGPAFSHLEVTSPLIGGAGAGVIANARIRTQVPRYPLRTPQGVAYPTGEFWTVLCGPELAEARDRGELLEVGAGHGYVLRHWAAEWAEWACRVLDGQEPEVGPLLRQMVKGFSKTVWGRTAMRVTGTVRDGDGPTEELRIESGWDQSAGCNMTIIDWGWGRRVELQDAESDDAFPAILAWVQSWTRVLVSRLVDAVGTGAVVQVATDGILVAPWRLAELAWERQEPIHGEGTTSDVAAAGCRALAPDVVPLTVRLKDVLHRVHALGPDTVEAAETRKVSGVPVRATRVGPWTYEGEVWPSFATMTQVPISGAVLVQTRRWDVSKVRPLRWVHSDGCCEPLTAALEPSDGSTRVLAPSEPACGHNAALLPLQHHALNALLGGRELIAVPAPELTAPP